MNDRDVRNAEGGTAANLPMERCFLYRETCLLVVLLAKEMACTTRATTTPCREYPPNQSNGAAGDVVAVPRPGNLLDWRLH